MLSPADEYLYGDEASVQCYRGFRLTGSAVITCGPEQEFINVPECEGEWREREREGGEREGI